jgi:putative flippase GtrA
MKNRSDQQYPELARLARFIVFGVAGTAVDYLSFISVMTVGLEPELAKAFGYLVAITFTTLFISRFVFKAKVTPKNRLKTLVLYLCTGILNVLAFSMMHKLQLDQNLAFLFATTLAASVNYFFVRALSLS